MREKPYYFLLSIMALLLASFPYIYGILRTPTGHVYTGFTVNIDDTYVYLAWMRQAADGSFFQRNLFTTEDQKGIVFNLWFWLLGNICRFTHLPLIATYHLARLAGGAGFLWAVTKLLGVVFSGENALKLRKVAFAFVCFASGLGWLFPISVPNSPIDGWQPEAISFLSLYYSPLFAPALMGIVVFWWGFLSKKLIPAAIAVFLLGNFHSYDVIPLFAIAGVYQFTGDLQSRKLDKAGWTRLIILGLAALPTTLYQYYALRSEQVFYNRAFVGEGTWTPSPHWVLLGIGLLLVYATFARAKHFAGQDAFRFCVTWAIVGVLVAYIPGLNFQRKLLMGVQIPFCFLASAGLCSLCAKLSGDLPKAALPLGILLTMPSNLLFLLQDTGRLDANLGSTNHQPYLKIGEVEALDWLKNHIKRDDFVLVSPDPTSHKRFPYVALMPYLSVQIPALGNGIVYNGHWSETVGFQKDKLPKMMSFFGENTSEEKRQEILKTEKIKYVLVHKQLGAEPLVDEHGEVFYTPVRWAQDQSSIPSYLELAFQNSDVIIFKVKNG